ncbi:MAG: SAM-dependent methyltransferase [Saprospiraceae bacterium]|nr:MAG: SAM-dependent methyltransferase [Saprospiraceae bacterium]
MQIKKIFLKPKRDIAVKRFHPWVFSGAVTHLETPIEDGTTVEVYSHGKEYLATGHYQNGSICVRIVSFRQGLLDQDFWNEKLGNAFTYRQSAGLTDRLDTNAFRLVHAEGDGLPGLVIDIYHQTAVIQCHSIGMHLAREKIAAALRQILPDLKIIYDKSRETLPARYAETITNTYLYGNATDDTILEYGNVFAVDWESGQKTGFFLDQRENRHLLSQYASGKTVLNAFCYSGGFSIYALKAGAKQVHSVDVSQKAIDLTEKNVLHNGFSSDQHQAHASDVMQFLKDADPIYDLMIVDPPAFAKNLKKRHNAVQGYKRLNAAAMQKIKTGGYLFTFSCSQVVDQPLFYNTIVAAALEAGRQARVMHHLTQPPDHPVSLFHPEGAYLKGLVLQII